MNNKHILDKVGEDNCVECGGVGMYSFEGRKYCPKHYSVVINKKAPVGRASMGAATVVINEGAGI